MEGMVRWIAGFIPNHYCWVIDHFASTTKTKTNDESTEEENELNV